MKRRSRHQILTALSACILLSLSNSGLTEETVATPDPDTSKWVCKFCLGTNGWFGEWDLGLVLVNDATPKFADYRGLIDDGAYLQASGNISFRNEDGYYFDFYGRNLGLDSRSLEMRGGQQGSFELRASYSEIPRYQGYNTQTPYLGVGTDTLVLPESWQTQPLTPARLESKRETMGAGFTVKMGSAWKLKADYEHQSRDGTRTFSGGLFATGAALFPAPIDFNTDIVNLGLAFNGKRGQVSLDFTGSEFNNGDSALTWDNPLAIGFGDEVSRNALEPDNEYYQFSLSGAFRFSPRFRLSGKASIGSAEQNDAFLPYSINPAHEGLALPRSSLDGKLDTSFFNLSGRLYARLADRLDLTAQYKVRERDNRTPIDIYTPILLEVFPGDPRSNRPYSYDNSQARLELRYRPGYHFRINVGAKRDEVERTFQEVDKTDEDTYWGELQFSPWTWLDARLKLDHRQRDATPSEQQGNYDRAEHPLMRKFNMATRERKRATIEFDLYPSEAFGISLSYYTTEDDYDDSLIGLNASEENSLSLDLNYAINKHTSLYAFASINRIESSMSGADDFESLPWDAFTDDEIRTWGIGISGRINDRLSYGFDYLFSDSDGDISSASETPFPVLQTELQNVRLYLDYKLNDRWKLGLDAYREEYVTSDWMVDGVGPFDITSVLTMGETSPDYETNVIRLLATLNF